MRRTVAEQMEGVQIVFVGPCEGSAVGKREGNLCKVGCVAWNRR